MFIHKQFTVWHVGIVDRRLCAVVHRGAHAARAVVVVNGKIGFGSPPAGEQYWNGRKSPFIQGAIKYWNDKEIFFTDKDYKPLSSAKSRISAGYRYAEDNIKK